MTSISNENFKAIRAKIIPSKTIPIESTERAFEEAERFFEPKLVELELSEEQISELITPETIEDLKARLERVNDAIKNFLSFGALKFRIGESDQVFEVDILPVLFERKEKVVEGLRWLQSEKRIEELRKLIQDEGSEELKMQFEKQIAVLKTEREDWKRKAEEVGREKIRAQLEKQNEQLIKLSSTLYDKKVRFWRTLIERESAATIVGSILLMLICFFMFFVAAIDVVLSLKSGIQQQYTLLKDALGILGNAFLLILGYFFGQTAASLKKEKNEG